MHGEWYTRDTMSITVRKDGRKGLVEVAIHCTCHCLGHSD